MHTRYSSVIYTIYPKSSIDDDTLNQCAELFSKNYGKWSRSEKNVIKNTEGNVIADLRGKMIRLSTEKLKRDYLFKEDCGLVTASVVENGSKTLVGHAFFCMCPVNIGSEPELYTKSEPDLSLEEESHLELSLESESSLELSIDFNIFNITWITQLVVRMDYRSKGISKYLMYYAKGLDSLGVGMVTSNPYAVKSLESVMGKKYDISRVEEFADQIVKDCGIRYFSNAKLHLDSSTNVSIIDTNFYVDHSEIEENLDTLDEDDWQLTRELPEGFEYFVLIMV